MSIRLHGAITLVVLATLFSLLAALTAAPAFAAVEDGVDAEEAPPPPDFEDICVEGSLGAEFCPEAYEQPEWFQWLIFPLLGAGLFMVVAMGFFYLVWQPRFARERETQGKRR